MEGSDSGPNVLLVVLDSVRAADCSLYGTPRPTTPFLRSFAEGATTYTQARAPSNWTLPSHVSLLTGLETHDHRVTVHDRLQSGSTVFEALEARGYGTGLFTENGFLSSHEVGVKDCFETVVGVPDEYAGRYDTTSLNPGPDGFYYADRFLAWSDGIDGPWAACLNLMDAHRPFEPREEFDRWGDARARELQSSLEPRWEWTFHGGERPYWQLAGLASLYRGGIRQADAVVARVVDELRGRGALDGTLVVVCGDHGDGFGEPGRLDGEPRAVSHIVPMHESLLHVPLVVKAPGQEVGRRVHDPATLSRFPDVVLGHTTGDAGADGFTTGTALASKQPVTADLRERFERHCGDVAPYAAPSRAVYTSAGGTAVRKRYYWGGSAGELLIHGPGTVEFRGEIDRESVDDAFDDPDAAVREPLAGRQVTDGTKDHLAALGYY
jgi:arylsulfatase A